MNKQELLKNLENTLEANKQENSERVEKITEQLTNELLFSLEKKLENVPKNISNYILNKVVLTVLFTTLTLIIFGIWGYMIWEIKKQNEELSALKSAQIQYDWLKPYINLEKIEVAEKDGNLYITTKDKNGEAYKNESYTAILMIGKQE